MTPTLVVKYMQALSHLDTRDTDIVHITDKALYMIIPGFTDIRGLDMLIMLMLRDTNPTDAMGNMMEMIMAIEKERKTGIMTIIEESMTKITTGITTIMSKRISVEITNGTVRTTGLMTGITALRRNGVERC